MSFKRLEGLFADFKLICLRSYLFAEFCGVLKIICLRSFLGEPRRMSGVVRCASSLAEVHRMSIHYTSDGEPRPNYIPNQDIDASERTEQQVPVDDPLSDDFEPEDVWAKRHRINRKTVARYRNIPDGLPLFVGRRKL